MSDWKQDYQERMKKEVEARRAEENPRAHEQYEKDRQRKEREYAEKMAKHQREFRCHFCGKVSSGPESERVYRFMESENATDGGQPGTITTKWSASVDIKKCWSCGQMACANDYLEGGHYKKSRQVPPLYVPTVICRNCAQTGKRG